MDYLKHLQNSGRNRLPKFVLTVLLFNLISFSDSQSTIGQQWQHCHTLGNCLSTSDLLDKLTEENTFLKELTNRLKTDLQDHAQRLRDLRFDLDNAISRTKDIVTTKATYNLPDHTTSIASISTRPPQTSQYLTTISPVADSIALFGGYLYTFYNVTPQAQVQFDHTLTVHNALNGSFLGVISSPRVIGKINVDQAAVCRRNSQLFITLQGDLYYADISQIESNRSLVWQKYSATYYNKTRYTYSYFQLSDDCQEFFLLFGDSEVQIRRLSDGQLLAARNMTTLRVHTIAGSDQRYYISHSDKNNGNSYVIEYDQELNEVRRYTALPSTGPGGAFYEHYVASYDKGGVFVTSAIMGKVILLSPDFMSFIEVVPNVKPWGLAYDPERKLLAAVGIAQGIGSANIYNITIA